MKNTIIIMTSNIASDTIAEGVLDEPLRKQKIMAALKGYFRIEFLNRIDDIVIYESLTQESLRRITSLLLDELQLRAKNQGYELHFSDHLRHRVATL